MIEERLIEIETKLAFAEQTIEDLSGELYLHQKRFEKLEESFQTLKMQLEKLMEDPMPRKLEDEIPPHY